MKSYHNLVCFSFVLYNVHIVAIVDTDPIVSSCVDCGRSFRTYVPDSYCNLPDGSSVTFSTPQTVSFVWSLWVWWFHEWGPLPRTRPYISTEMWHFALLYWLILFGFVHIIKWHISFFQWTFSIRIRRETKSSKEFPRFEAAGMLNCAAKASARFL